MKILKKKKISSKNKIRKQKKLIYKIKNIFHIFKKDKKNTDYIDTDDEEGI